MRDVDAVLCDLDGVLRWFDGDRQRWIERHYELPVLATAFAPERMVPAVLGQITAAQWLTSIAAALGGHPAAVRATEEFAAVEFWMDEQVWDPAELRAGLRGDCGVFAVTENTHGET
ncbi:hypothetical protein [Nocardia sp. SSK8]|uniref:hypothetical protein n=1 Tax=Nocardia sp. SSK8 TaxID=3120154 RepID=UPI00300AA8FD